MSRKAVLIVAFALAFAAVTGTIALTRTAGLGRTAAAGPAATRLIARRTAQLNRFEASLRAELGRRPPAVPKLPATPLASVAAAPAAERVVYRRPAPVVVHLHRPGGEHEGADRGEGGGVDD